MRYYTYLYRTPEGVPYYVGSGTEGRALAPHHRKNHPDVIIPPTGGRTLEFIEYDISKEEAEELEQFIIAELGRKDNGTGILENLTDGGLGRTGYNPSSAERQLHKNAATKNHSEGKYDNATLFGGIEAMRERAKKPRSESWKQKMKGRVTVTDTRTGESYKVNAEEYWSNPPCYLVPAGTGISKKKGYVLCYNVRTGETRKVTSEEFRSNDDLVGVTSAKRKNNQ